MSWVTNHEAVLNGTQGQSVEGIVDTAVDDATLSPEALCVDDRCPPPPRHHIKSTQSIAVLSIYLLLCWRVGARTIRNLPESEEVNVRRRNWLETHDVFFHVAAPFVMSVFLTVLISVTHQRLADALPCGSEDRQTAAWLLFDSVLLWAWDERRESSHPIGSETCLHIRPLEGSRVWFHRPGSETAPHHRGSLRTERRQPSLGFWTVTYDMIPRVDKEIYTHKHINQENIFLI